MLFFPEEDLIVCHIAILHEGVLNVKVTYGSQLRTSAPIKIVKNKIGKQAFHNFAELLLHLLSLSQSTYVRGGTAGQLLVSPVPSRVTADPVCNLSRLLRAFGTGPPDRPQVPLDCGPLAETLPFGASCKQALPPWGAERTVQHPAKVKEKNTKPKTEKENSNCCVTA